LFVSNPNQLMPVMRTGFPDDATVRLPFVDRKPAPPVAASACEYVQPTFTPGSVPVVMEGFVPPPTAAPLKSKFPGGCA
jgi:hypothetical protein